MSGYTITIGTRGAKDGSQTTIQVDTSTGSPRITELTVRPASGAGLSPDQLPVVDLPTLIQALNPSAGLVAGSTESEAVVVSAPRPRGRRAKATGAGSRRGGRRKAAIEVEAAPDTGRAYRKMPDQNEVFAAFQEVGSVKALAEHYGVPRHTVNGWLRRLRKLGVIGAE